MNIGITGASGMLGTALIEGLNSEYKIYATSRKKGVSRENVEWDCFDLLDFNKLNNWLVVRHLDVIIHCAAIVNVDECEQYIYIAKELHYKTTKIIANYLNRSGGKLIYISTDSLFNGKKIGLYTEKDTTNPLNVYAKTKLSGEKPVLQMKNGVVIRTNIIGCVEEGKTSFSDWIISNLKGKKMIKLFDDVVFSPLHVSDLSVIICKMIVNNAVGVYNAGSSTSLSKYEFGLILADIFNFESKYIEKSCIACTKSIADRPHNMGLSTNKLSLLLNEKMPTVERGIQLLKNQYVNNKNR